MCDFFDAETTMPSGPYTYDYSTIGSPGWLTTVQFQTSETIKNTSGGTLDGIANNHTLTLTETQAYETAAVMMAEMQTYLNGNPANPGNTVTDFNYAVWYLFNQNLSLNGTALTLNTNQQTDLFNAAAIVTSSTQTNMQITAADSAKLVIYTYPPGTEQEFLGELTPTGAAPEPASWALFGVLGLLLIPGVRSKISRGPFPALVKKTNPRKTPLTSGAFGPRIFYLPAPRSRRSGLRWRQLGQCLIWRPANESPWLCSRSQPVLDAIRKQNLSPAKPSMDATRRPILSRRHSSVGLCRKLRRISRLGSVLPRPVENCRAHGRLLRWNCSSSLLCAASLEVRLP